MNHNSFNHSWTTDIWMAYNCSSFSTTSSLTFLWKRFPSIIFINFKRIYKCVDTEPGIWDYFNQMIRLSKPFWVLSLSLRVCKLTFVPENSVPPSSQAASLWPLSKPRLIPELALVLSLGYLYSWVGPWWEPLTEVTPDPWAQSAQWPVIVRQPPLNNWFLEPAYMSPCCQHAKS